MRAKTSYPDSPDLRFPRSPSPPEPKRGRQAYTHLWTREEEMVKCGSGDNAVGSRVLRMRQKKGTKAAAEAKTHS